MNLIIKKKKKNCHFDFHGGSDSKESTCKQTPFVSKVRKKCHLFHKVVEWIKEKHGAQKKNNMCKKL